MYIVWLTALGVGGATVVGAIIGFAFKGVSHKFGDVILSFAAGVMLAAAVIGLIQPSLEYGGKEAFFVTAAGIFTGAAALNFIDKFVPHLHRLAGVKGEVNERLNKVLLFVTAIAIHNLPEGIAAGVGVGAGNMAEAITVAGGIALQNIPEGMVIIAPMMSAGISSGRTLICAVFTGLIEVMGTFMGYLAVSLSRTILPFALAFAGGTMLYVIIDEMIPEVHSGGGGKGASFSLVAGFCVMLATDFYLQ